MSARATAIVPVIRALGASWGFRVRGGEHLVGLRRAGQPFIYALWHSQILPLIWFHRGTPASLLVSAHRDGGVLAKVAAGWGFGLIRGSSTRGAASAMRGILRTLESGEDVAVTPDGPRGPAGIVKPGILRAAQVAGVPILPVRADVSRFWRLRSWDRFLVPRPFAAIEVVYAPPLIVERGHKGYSLVCALGDALDGRRGGLC